MSVTTGNPKDLVGAKKAPLRFVPPSLAIAVAPIMELGAIKYNNGVPCNWRQYPIKAMVYLEAAQRHLSAYSDGEDLDPESGKPHLWHAAACIAILIDSGLIGTLIDDRPLPGPSAEMLRELDRSKG